jgi:hypothetical protein
MGIYYTAIGLPIILREMVNQNIAEEYVSRNKSSLRGNLPSADEKIKAAGKKFQEAFEDALEGHREEE